MYPDAVDAAITAWPQPHGGNLSVLKRFLRAAPRAKPGYFRRHKYVVDVDGNVQSNRFREVMSHDAIVLKATRFTSAYAPSLPSLPHVIRIRPDLSDLVPTLRCLQQHDAAALRALTRGMTGARFPFVTGPVPIPNRRDGRRCGRRRRHKPFVGRDHPIANALPTLRWRIQLPAL